MSGGMALAFGVSLIRPPSLVETMAALGNPPPGPEATGYLRAVTAIWCGFLACNTLISAATAIWCDLATWTLYNGLISYLLMGALFGAENITRRRVLRRATAPCP